MSAPTAPPHTFAALLRDLRPWRKADAARWEAAQAEVAAAESADSDAAVLAAARRPLVRGDCTAGGFNAARPCPFASCRYSLLIDVDPGSGKVLENAEDPTELPHSCALDIADLVDNTDRTVILRSLEPYFGITREHVRQLELRAIRSFSRAMNAARCDEPGPEVRTTPWGSHEGSSRSAGSAEKPKRTRLDDVVASPRR